MTQRPRSDAAVRSTRGFFSRWKGCENGVVWKDVLTSNWQSNTNGLDASNKEQRFSSLLTWWESSSGSTTSWSKIFGHGIPFGNFQSLWKMTIFHGYVLYKWAIYTIAAANSQVTVVPHATYGPSSLGFTPVLFLRGLANTNIIPAWATRNLKAYGCYRCYRHCTISKWVPTGQIQDPDSWFCCPQILAANPQPEGPVRTWTGGAQTPGRLLAPLTLALSPLTLALSPFFGFSSPSLSSSWLKNLLTDWQPQARL